MKQNQSSRKHGMTVRDRIAMILQTEISDPRLSMITVTEARVSKDRSVCNIYITTDPSRYDEVSKGLESAKGRIRSILGKGLGWRVTPELRFMIDTTLDEAEAIDQALLNVPPTLLNEREQDNDE